MSLFANQARELVKGQEPGNFDYETIGGLRALADCAKLAGSSDEHDIRALAETERQKAVDAGRTPGRVKNLRMIVEHREKSEASRGLNQTPGGTMLEQMNTMVWETIGVGDKTPSNHGEVLSRHMKEIWAARARKDLGGAANNLYEATNLMILWCAGYGELPLIEQLSSVMDTCYKTVLAEHDETDRYVMRWENYLDEALSGKRAAWVLGAVETYQVKGQAAIAVGGKSMCVSGVCSAIDEMSRYLPVNRNYGLKLPADSVEELYVQAVRAVQALNNRKLSQAGDILDEITNLVLALS